MKKISLLGVVLLLSSFIFWSGRKQQIETEVNFDYNTYVFMKNNISIIDSIFKFRYEVRGNKYSFYFREKYDTSLKEKLVRVTFIDSIFRIAMYKDSGLHSVKLDIDSIDSNVIKKIYRDVFYYDKLFKKINCIQVSDPRLGFGLMYFPQKSVESDKDLVVIEKDWYYNLSKWKGSERKYLLKMIDEKFGSNASN